MTVLGAERWADQPLIWTERARGRGLRWPPAASGFANDPLGHRAHAHPGAAEIYFVAAGRLELRVGATDVTLEQGDFCFIPAGAFHDPRGNHGTELCLFALVAPNRRGQRWQTAGFDARALHARPSVVPTGAVGELPGDARLSSEIVALEPGATTEGDALRSGERTLYVLGGELDVRVDRLAGRLGANEYTHVPSGCTHGLANRSTGTARVLSIVSRDPDEAGG